MTSQIKVEDSLLLAGYQPGHGNTVPQGWELLSSDDVKAGNSTLSVFYQNEAINRTANQHTGKFK